MEIRVLAGVLLPALLAACGGKPAEPPRDLARAVAVVGYLASPRFVNASAWSSVAEKGTPSEFASYLFSDLGAAELPETARAGEPGGAGRGGPPSWPEGVALRPVRPDPGPGRQVVIVPDDARNRIVAEGYLDPRSPPVVRREFELARPRKR
jgi:hypothetical protein